MQETASSPEDITRGHSSDEVDEALPAREDNNGTIPISHQDSVTRTLSLSSTETAFKKIGFIAGWCLLKLFNENENLHTAE